MEHRVTHFRDIWASSLPTLEGVPRMIAPYVWGSKCYGIVFEGENKIRLKYLATTMIASWSPRKSTYATLLRFAMKAMTTILGTSRLVYYTSSHGICYRVGLKIG